MPNLPPLGTTSSQPAKKPKGNPQYPVTTPLNTFIQMPDSNAYNRVVPPASPVEQMMYGPPSPPEILGPPAPKPDYVDTTQTPLITPEETLEQKIKRYQEESGNLNLKPLPAALAALTLPASPVRDIKGEGKARAEEAGLATWLPLISLLTTGNVSAGVSAMPGAYSSIAAGTEKFQDKLFTAGSENYKDTIQRILNQYSIDESIRNQQVGIVNAENQNAITQKRDELAGIKTLIDYDIAENRAKRELEKTYGAQRTAFLRQLQRTPEHQQLAYWNTHKDQWDAWNIKPLFDETGKYIPLGWNSDVIGYANAKSREEMLKFVKDSFGVKTNQWKQQHALNVQKATDIVTMRNLDRSARVEIAKLARESAWDRMMVTQDGLNARFNATQEQKDAFFFMRFGFERSGRAGVKINQLFDRAEGLRLHRRSLEDKIQAILKDKTKFSKKDRESLIAGYEAELETIKPLINDAEARVATIIDQKDSGTLTETFVERWIPDGYHKEWYEFLDPKGATAGDAGSKAKVGPAESRAVRVVPRKYEKGFGGPPPVGKPGRPAPRGARPPQGRTSPPRKPLPADLSKVSTDELLNRAKGR